MHSLVLYLLVFLPVVNTYVVVKIARSSLYYPNSSCAFLRNATWWTQNVSIDTCIWECVHEYDCQTAIYYHNDKSCSMFSELCDSGRISTSGYIRASVICYRKYHGKFFYFSLYKKVHV